MPVTLDSIAIEFGAQWTGGGTINRLLTDLNRVARATKEVYSPVKSTSMITGIDSMSQRYAAAGAAALQYSAKIADVERRMMQLGQSMSALPTHAVPSEAIDAYRKMAIEANELKAGLAGVSQVNATGSLNTMIRTVAPLATAFGAAAAAAWGLAKAFVAVKDIAAEGAGIRQTGESFRFLTEEMFNVPGLLDKMRVASRGTISDFQLMSSYMTLVAGATPEFGSAISAAVPQLVEIAKAANVLNPALGDTTFFFESLARGIKRTEYRLIDNLGLNVRVGEANQRYAASIGKTVQELTAMERQQAFLNEVLRVGGQLIQQVGGDVDSLVDPYQRWDAATENLANSLKSLVSISFAPMMEELSGVAGVWSEFYTSIVTDLSNMDTAGRGGGGMLGMFTSLSAGVKEGVLSIPGFRLIHGAVTGITVAMQELMDIMNLIGKGGTFADWLSGTTPLTNPLEGIKPDAITEGAAAFQLWKQSATGAIYATGGFAEHITEITSTSEKSVPVLKDVASAIQAIEDALGQQRRAGRSVIQDLIQQNALMEEFSELAHKAMGRSDWQAENARQMEEQIGLIDAMRQAWIDAAAVRQQTQTQGWQDIFAGGEFDSDWIIGNIRNVGEAWITSGGATEFQTEKLEELNSELERSRDKLWDLQHGIGVQGDEAESTSKKIEELSAEIANYETVIGQFQGSFAPTTTTKSWVGINLNDQQIFKDFIDTLGDSGASAQQLSIIAQGLGLIGPAAADAMLKVSLLDGVLKNLDLQLQAGEIDASQMPAAIQAAIAMIEGDGTYYDLVANVRVKVKEATAVVDRELQLPEEDRTREIDVGANLDPATRAFAEATGVIERAQTRFKIDADDKPARGVLNTLKSDIENTTVYLDIQGRYTPDPNQPQGNSTTSTTHTGPQRVRTGGYIVGGKGQAVPVIAHGGEFVIRPEAVERLGVGFLEQLNRASPGAASNNITLANNFYAPIGSGEARQVIINSAQDAGEELVDVLKRAGYRLTG